MLEQFNQTIQIVLLASLGLFLLIWGWKNPRGRTPQLGPLQRKWIIICALIASLLELILLVSPFVFPKKDKNISNIQGIASESLASFTLFNDPQAGITMNYPTTWSKGEKSGGTRFEAPQVGVNASYSIPNLSFDQINAIKADGKRFEELVLDQYKKRGINIRTISDRGQTIIDSFPAQTITIDLGNFHTRVIWLIKNDRLYVFDFVAATELSDMFAPVFSRIQESVRIQ